MSFFNWFNNKKNDKIAATPESSGLGLIDATVPVTPDRMRLKHAPSTVNHAANRKTERLERRELIYGVVRDSMTRAGVLAACYKFKVLSLDAGGHQYLIMVDLANQSAGNTGRLAEIEATMAQAAKMRHDILVSAVYWRANETVTSGLSQSHNASSSQQQHTATASRTEKASPSQLLSTKLFPKYEPLQQDEVVAFKRALASALPAVPLSASGKIVTSGPRNLAPPVEFEDTQMVAPDERSSPLSGTQYGDLT